MPPRTPSRHPPNKSPGRPAGSTSFDPAIALAFGNEIRQARLQAQVSQEGLALASGVERSYLGRIERGHSMPTLGVVLKLCRALQVSSGMVVEQVDFSTAPPARKRASRG